MVTPLSWRLLELFPHYKRNYLLRSGGIGDQSNVYLQGMVEIDALIAEGK